MLAGVKVGDSPEWVFEDGRSVVDGAAFLCVKHPSNAVRGLPEGVRSASILLQIWSIS